MEDLEQKAKDRWIEFNSSRKKYFPGRRKKMGFVRIAPLITTYELMKNIFKLAGDGWSKLKERRKWKNLTQAELSIFVMARNDIFQNRELKRLWMSGRNRKVILHLAEEELYKEILATHWLMIRGVDVENFRHLMKNMGENPWAFLSGDRKENGGRLVIDNKLVNGLHPFIEKNNPIYKKELRFWSKIFPNSPDWVFWGKWYFSRTHCPIYVIKDHEKKDIIILPIHIDPKNGMTIFSHKYRDDKGMWAYHQFGQKRHTQYVGTGLYELGCKYFIYLMRKAEENRLIGKVAVYGENKLDTTGSIYLDDKFTDQLEKLSKIFITDRCEQKKQDPLLLIHGWPFSAKIFDQTIDELQSDFTILAPDLPGFGFEPRFVNKRHTVDNYVHWLKKYLDDYAIDKVTISGTSFGGAVAVQFANRYPEMVKKLILCSVPYYWRNLSDKRISLYKNLLNKMPQLGFLAAELNKRTLNKEVYFASHPFVKKYVSEEKLWEYYKEFCSYDDKAAVETFQEIIKLDLRNIIPRLRMPILVIAGENDGVVKTGDEYGLMRLIRNGRLAIVEEADHALPAEHPRELAGLIRSFTLSGFQKIDHEVVPTMIVEPGSEISENDIFGVKLRGRPPLL